jgi:hypothetical protein
MSLSPEQTRTFNIPVSTGMIRANRHILKLSHVSYRPDSADPVIDGFSFQKGKWILKDKLFTSTQSTDVLCAFLALCHSGSLTQHWPLRGTFKKDLDKALSTYGPGQMKCSEHRGGGFWHSVQLTLSQQENDSKQGRDDFVQIRNNLK